MTELLSLVQRLELLFTFNSTTRMMNNLSIALTLLCAVYGVVGGRRYIAIPVDGIDGIDVIEMNPIAPSLPRMVRQTEAYVPIAISSIPHQDDSEVQRSERSATRVLDYVDFGGHTGSNGAFSWYADYPAHRL